MANPLESLIPKDRESRGDPNGMAGKGEMLKAANTALHPPTESSGAHAVNTSGMSTARTPSPWEKGPQKPYGTTPGGPEKRVNTDYLNKPTAIKGVMHDGGTVKETGAHILKKGEKVLTPEDHSKLKSAMSLASAALSHGDNEPQPAKMIRAMHIRKASDGSHVIEHHHVDFSHPMEEHTAKNMDELHDHLEQHWGSPNDGEAESESEKDESPGVKAAEKAIGLEK